MTPARTVIAEWLGDIPKEYDSEATADSLVAYLSGRGFCLVPRDAVEEAADLIGANAYDEYGYPDQEDRALAARLRECLNEKETT